MRDGCTDPSPEQFHRLIQTDDGAIGLDLTGIPAGHAYVCRGYTNDEHRYPVIGFGYHAVHCEPGGDLGDLVTEPHCVFSFLRLKGVDQVRALGDMVRLLITDAEKEDEKNGRDQA